jgi:hypothetical protein
MLAETIQLETLRQKIEDVEYEAGSQSDYLDRGGPNPAQVRQAQTRIDKMNSQSQLLKAELKELIARVRVQQPQAIEEWVNYHVGILQKIADEKTTGTMEAVRRSVAKTTIQEWEKVRAGEQEYVTINWYYLKDYKSHVRKMGKAWWQFWK